MITATELRIGNWVLSPHGPVCAAEVLYSNITVMDSYSRVYNFHQDELKGILLDWDALLACGFEIHREGSKVLKKTIRYEDTDYPCTLQRTGDGIQICRSGVGAITAYMKYLHQLQNLYFALTGKELQCSPK